MLKYGKDSKYKAESLTAPQEKLIDGIADYGIKWANYEGYKDLAEEMSSMMLKFNSKKECMHIPFLN